MYESVYLKAESSNKNTDYGCPEGRSNLTLLLSSTKNIRVFEHGQSGERTTGPILFTPGPGEWLTFKRITILTNFDSYFDINWLTSNNMVWSFLNRRECPF